MLLEALPREVIVGGAAYDIDSDFRAMLRLAALLEGEDPPHQKLFGGLRIFYRRIWPRDTRKAVEAMMDFFRCGEKPRREEGGGKRLYSFTLDAPYIYAAFMQQYHMDLCDIEYLHWYKFRALWAALGEDTQFVKIMGYRGADISGMSKEAQARYRKLQRLYALPHSAAEEAENRAIEEALLRGGMP